MNDEPNKELSAQDVMDEMNRLRDPILSFPTQAQTHDEFRRVCRRGFILHQGNTPYVRPKNANEVRGKAAVKAAKRERRALREIREEIAQNGV